MTPDAKLRMIRDILDHPTSYHHGGQSDVCRMIRRVIDAPAPEAKVIKIDEGVPRWAPP